MQVIYIDTLFMINFIINYLILLTTAKICSIQISRLRIAAAGVLGSTYSIMVIFDALAFLTNPFIKLVVGMLMVLTVFGGRRELLRASLVFFAVSAAFGGAVLAVSLLSGSNIMGGELFIPVSLKILLISFIVCYIILTLVFRRMARQKKGGGIAEIIVEHNGKKVRLNALVDTGNSLTDPMTGNSVIVVGYSDLYCIFNQETKTKLSELGEISPIEAMEELNKMGEIRFCLIPYRAVGIKCGMLLAFRPARISINGRERKGTLIALSPNSVSDGGVYSALMGA